MCLNLWFISGTWLIWFSPVECSVLLDSFDDSLRGLHKSASLIMQLCTLVYRCWEFFFTSYPTQDTDACNETVKISRIHWSHWIVELQMKDSVSQMPKQQMNKFWSWLKGFADWRETHQVLRIIVNVKLIKYVKDKWGTMA